MCDLTAHAPGIKKRLSVEYILLGQDIAGARYQVPNWIVVVQLLGVEAEWVGSWNIGQVFELRRIGLQHSRKWWNSAIYKKAVN